MSTEKNLAEVTVDDLDPQQIFEETAALARHLRDSGVQWLPAADPESVKHWNHQFQIDNEVHPSRDSGGLSVRVPDLDKPPTTIPQPTTAVETRSSGIKSGEDLHGSYSGHSLSDDQRHACLADLAGQVANCHKCPQLASGRQNTVFGEGSVRPRIIFFGEAPGADEDRSGRPFVGAAGQLLTKMIEACKFDRSEVYILNTIKCRPPNNRNPEQEEKSNCRSYYQTQIDTLRPEYIICLGAVAAQELLQTKASVGSLRGKFHQYYDSKVLVTYHPAYLLREPTRKKAAWQDLQMMLRDAKIDF